MDDYNHDIKEVPVQASNGESEHVSEDLKPAVAVKINQLHAEMYHEALQLYPNDDAIDKEDERRLRRKLDMRILPLLGICYFFYVGNFLALLSRASANNLIGIRMTDSTSVR